MPCPCCIDKNNSSHRAIDYIATLKDLHPSPRRSSFLIRENEKKNTYGFFWISIGILLQYSDAFKD